MQVVVARSACRCLFYEHRNPIPAKGKEPPAFIGLDPAGGKTAGINDAAGNLMPEVPVDDTPSRDAALTDETTP